MTQNFESNAKAALQAMRADPAVSYFTPSDDVWDQTPTHTRIALILMYQTLTQKPLLDLSGIRIWLCARPNGWRASQHCNLGLRC